ncbi:MAG: hypothetical protein D6714_04850, partial [Bacteroidetes bacterium]
MTRHSIQNTDNQVFIFYSNETQRRKKRSAPLFETQNGKPARGFFYPKKTSPVRTGKSVAIKITFSNYEENKYCIC